MKLPNLLSVLFTLTLIGFGASSYAAQEHVEVDDNGVILAGHDVVSYFTENAAIEGQANYTATYNDAIYYFSSEDNRNTFNANPEKYAPQYGGFCAYGAALGKKFDIDGKAFEVVDGKLYVNKNLDVYEAWVEDKAENIEGADKQWPEILNIAASDL